MCSAGVGLYIVVFIVRAAFFFSIPQLRLLPLGAVHNSTLCSTLVNYLRTPSVPFKAQVRATADSMLRYAHAAFGLHYPRVAHLGCST